MRCIGARSTLPCACTRSGALLPNENVRVACKDQGATDWINGFFSRTNFMSAAQATVVRAFGLGTGAWALWLDLGKRKVRVKFDNSTIQDTAAEKEQDMREVGVTMSAWEYRMRWYGKEESVARARAAEIGTGNGAGRSFAAAGDR